MITAITAAPDGMIARIRGQDYRLVAYALDDNGGEVRAVVFVPKTKRFVVVGQYDDSMVEGVFPNVT